jgi:hypothetical protein
MGTSKAKAKSAPKKQHDPTPEERDERVSLHPEKPDDVLRRLLRSTQQEQHPEK